MKLENLGKFHFPKKGKYLLGWEHYLEHNGMIMGPCEPYGFVWIRSPTSRMSQKLCFGSSFVFWCCWAKSMILIADLHTVRQKSLINKGIRDYHTGVWF